MKKTGRNEPCPCGSGRKYKKCCLGKKDIPMADPHWHKLRKTEGELMPELLKYADKHYGPQAVVEAWEEFTLWEDAPMDPESEPEFHTAFLPWFVFNWIPENNPEVGTGEYPEMPVALHYLDRMGLRIEPYRRRFIEEACSQPYSFFVVTDTVPGRQMMLRDLLLEREVTVHERQASTQLTKGKIVYSRTITIDGDSIMVGCTAHHDPADLSSPPDRFPRENPEACARFRKGDLAGL